MVSRRHPPGLYVLFFTELWERYSFYSMMAILSLYMNEALQFDVAHVGRVYGAYTAGVYFLPLFGGLLADRVLGFNRAVIAGGVLMMLGHLVLGVESLPFFYAGLVLLACGSGLLKPNVSTLVGNLYRDRPELRDQGFNIFYMGINLGAFISPLTVSWLRTHYGWGPAFMSAAGALVISLLVFIVFNRHVADAAVKVEENSVEARPLGAVVVAIALAMLAYAGMAGGDAGRVSAQWLIWANVIIALGELSLSPMGLSLVNMLAPPRNRGLLMGGWFASLATGGYLAGYIGGYWDRMPHSRFFLMVTLILIATAVPLSLMTLQIKRTIARSQTVPVGQ